MVSTETADFRICDNTIDFHRFRPIADNKRKYILSHGHASPYMQQVKCTSFGGTDLICRLF